MITLEVYRQMCTWMSKWNESIGLLSIVFYTIITNIALKKSRFSTLYIDQGTAVIFKMWAYKRIIKLHHTMVKKFIKPDTHIIINLQLYIRLQHLSTTSCTKIPGRKWTTCVRLIQTDAIWDEWLIYRHKRAQGGCFDDSRGIEALGGI